MDDSWRAASDIVRRLVGMTITRVSLDQWMTSLVAGDWLLTMEGEWTLYGTGGERLDAACELAVRHKFDLWQLLGLTVTRAEISNDCHVTLTFENRMVLGVYSNDDDMEDWQLHDGAVPQGDILICNGETLSIFSRVP